MPDRHSEALSARLNSKKSSTYGNGVEHSIIERKARGKAPAGSPAACAAAGRTATAGPFSVVDASGNASRDIQVVFNTSAEANSAQCAASGGTRTLQVQRRCSNAYGAALMSIEEVD